MQVVVNGDDLGYTKANSLGIIRAFHDGILRSTTALVNAPHIEFARDAAADLDGLGVGIHLTLTLGAPLTNGVTIARNHSAFFNIKELCARKDKLNPTEVHREFKAQIERFIELFGRKPTHLDSHHAVHDITPDVLAVSRHLAEEYGLEMRRHGRFTYVGGFMAERATAETLIALMEEHAGEDIEIMCHPGYCDLELYRKSSYNLDRVRELDALCNPMVLAYVHEHGIKLAHY